MNQIHLKRTLAHVLFVGVAGMAIAVAPSLRPLAAAPAKSAPAAGLDAQDQRITSAVTQSLRNRVTSPTGKLQLSVHPTARSSEGYFSEIHLAGRPAQIKKLRLEELVMHARNVRIDVPYLLQTGKLRTLAAKTSLRAVITEDALTNVLAAGRHTKSMGLKVKYLKHATWGDVIQVTGNWNLGRFLNGPISGMGKLKVTPDYKVHMDILSLKLNGREVPAFVKNKFMEKMNPILDYEDLPFRPRFKAVKVQGSKATLFS